MKIQMITIKNYSQNRLVLVPSEASLRMSVCFSTYLIICPPGSRNIHCGVHVPQRLKPDDFINPLTFTWVQPTHQKILMTTCNLYLEMIGAFRCKLHLSLDSPSARWLKLPIKRAEDVQLWYKETIRISSLHDCRKLLKNRKKVQDEGRCVFCTLRLS